MQFIDLAAQKNRISDEIDTAIRNVLNHGRYVMGPEVSELETQLASFGEAKYALSCANGTDALSLVMMAWDIKAGDAVFCPSFTFAATAEIVAYAGATPIFIDVDPHTYNIDINSLERAIAQVKGDGTLTPRVIIAVDIFGQTADYPALHAISKRENMKLVADSAQGFGATLHGKHPLHWADITTTSFFPAKPLGCYGDGGAILTNDKELADIINSLRIHGKGTDKYDNVRVGINSRLDTLQAGILLAKLAIFPDEIRARNKIAARYNHGLGNVVIKTPTVLEGYISTWAQYTIEVDEPDALASALKEMGIPTARYYPRPVHRQSAYAHHPIEGASLAVTDDICTRILSLPMHPYLEEKDQDFIINTIRDFISE